MVARSIPLPAPFGEYAKKIGEIDAQGVSALPTELLPGKTIGQVGLEPTTSSLGVK